MRARTKYEFLAKHVFFATLFGVFVADLVTKVLVRKNLELHASIPLQFFSLTHTQNVGSLFGFLGVYDVNWVFAIITAAVIVWICMTAIKSKMSKLEYFGWGLVVGGATGNLFDRILYGAVTDFIDLKIWPVFNVADSAITVGLLLFITTYLSQDILRFSAIQK